MENKQELIEVEGENKISLRTQEGLIAVAQTYLKKNGDVILPPNYDVNDAVKALYLKCIQTVDKQKKPVLEVCTRESIEQVVQNYVSKGLNIAKNQCYIIPYGNTLTLQESYFGKQKQATEHTHIRQKANIIYEGEKFRVIVKPDGTKIVEHEPDFSKWNTDKIVGAYSVATFADTGVVDNTEVMTIAELKKSASKSQTGGTVYKEFPVEMYKKVVIARQAKQYINTSDDSAKFTLENDEGVDYSKLNEIDANNIIIEDNKKPTKTEPTNEQEMVVDELGEEQTKEIPYSEFKNNTDKYRAVPNSYDKETKTIRVYC